MKNKLNIIAREDEELGVQYDRGLGTINLRRTKKRWLLLLRVIYVGRRMLCTVAETHRRGIALRMDMAHRV